MSRLESFLFFILLCVSATLRFGWSDLVFYGPDQGLLLAIVDRFYELHHWPWLGLVGTKGVFYGPLPAWMLILLGGLGPDSIPLTTWFFYGINALHLAAAVYFLTGLRPLLRRPIWWMMALFTMTSPHLIFYARLLWDNTFLIVLSLFFCGFFIRQLNQTQNEQRPSRLLWIVGGLAAGAALSIHLFALPFVLATAYACSAAESSTQKMKKRDLGLFFCGMLLPVVPYLYGLFHAPIASEMHGDTAFRATRWLTGLRAVLIHWSDWLTGAGFLRYFATGKEIDLIHESLNTSRPVATTVYGVGIFLQVAVGTGGLFAIIQLLRTRMCHFSTLQLRFIGFALLAAAGHLLLAVIADATQHLHYFQAVWWTPFLLSALWWDRFGTEPWISCIKIAVIFLVIWNVSIEVLVGRFLRESRGYSTPQLGPTLALQRDVVDTLCQSTDAKQITLSRTVPDVSRSMMLWLSRHSDHCSDVTFLEPKSGQDITARYEHEPVPHIVWEGK